MAKGIIEQLASDYPNISKAWICGIALEAGLRQIVVPSGAPSAVRLPVEGGF